MNINISLTNVVINFQEIRHDFISEAGFKSIVDLEADKFGASFLSQGPLKRLILAQSKKTIVITPSNQLIVEDVSGEEPQDSTLLTQYFVSAYEVIKNNVSKPTAFGFNYSVIVKDVKNVKFETNWVSNITTKDVLGVGFRIIYNTEIGRNDLRVEPNINAKSEYIVNMNSHADTSMGEFSMEKSIRTIQESYVNNWTHLQEAVKKLME